MVDISKFKKEIEDSAKITESTKIERIESEILNVFREHKIKLDDCLDGRSLGITWMKKYGCDFDGLEEGLKSLEEKGLVINNEIGHFLTQKGIDTF